MSISSSMFQMHVMCFWGPNPRRSFESLVFFGSARIPFCKAILGQQNLIKVIKVKIIQGFVEEIPLVFIILKNILLRRVFFPLGAVLSDNIKTF